MDVVTVATSVRRATGSGTFVMLGETNRRKHVNETNDDNSTSLTRAPSAPGSRRTRLQRHPDRQGRRHLVPSARLLGPYRPDPSLAERRDRQWQPPVSYSYNDLLELKTIKKLLDAGIKLEQVRKVFEYLRKHVATDIAAAHIVIDGGSVMLCDGDQLVDVLKNGQGVLNVLSLGGVRDELEADLAPLTIRKIDIDSPVAPDARRTGGTLQRSPLDAEHRELGATMVEFGGWEMPIAYPSGTIEEHLACRNRAVMFDVSHLGTVRVEGPDAFDRLQSTLTNDLGKIEPGRAQYTHLLDASDDASVVDDIIVWWRPDDPDAFDVMPNASNTSGVRAAIGGVPTPPTSVPSWQCRGPTPRRSCRRCSPEAGAVGRFRVAALDWRDVPCTVAGTGYTGEDGIEIALPAEAAPALWRGARRTRASHLRVSERATRCASRAPCRCTVTNSDRGSRRCRQVWDGWSPGTSRPSSVATRRSPNASRGSDDAWSGSRPRADDQRVPGARSRSVAPSSAR
jgi:DNA-binding transcriptional MerR regulator